MTLAGPGYRLLVITKGDEMTQKVLPMNGVKRYNRRVVTGAAGVVALDRREGGEIVLRFLEAGLAWGEPAREISLDTELAEKLQQLLVDELGLEMQD